MKCKNCQESKCGEKFENKSECLSAKEKNKCSCQCQLVSAKRFGLLSAMAGRIFSKAVPAKAGLAEIMTPIQAALEAECETLEVSATEAVLTAAKDAANDLLEQEASNLNNEASGFVKLGVRVGAGAATGAINATLDGTVRSINDEEVDSTSIANAVGVSAFAGAINGASVHVVSNLSKVSGNEMVDAAARVALQAVNAASSDANQQLHEKGEIDPGQLISTTVDQIAAATAAELSHFRSNIEADQEEAECNQGSSLTDITDQIAVDLEASKKKVGVREATKKLFSRFRTNKPSTPTTPPVIEKVDP